MGRGRSKSDGRGIRVEKDRKSVRDMERPVGRIGINVRAVKRIGTV